MGFPGGARERWSHHESEGPWEELQEQVGWRENEQKHEAKYRPLSFLFCQKKIKKSPGVIYSMLLGL